MPEFLLMRHNLLSLFGSRYALTSSDFSHQVHLIAENILTTSPPSFSHVDPFRNIMLCVHVLFSPLKFILTNIFVSVSSSGKSMTIEENKHRKGVSIAWTDVKEERREEWKRKVYTSFPKSVLNFQCVRWSVLFTTWSELLWLSAN